MQNDIIHDTYIESFSDEEKDLLKKYMDDANLQPSDIVVFPSAKYKEFSNLFVTRFTLNNIEWRSTENYMQYTKVNSYIDEATLNEDDQKKLKKLREDLSSSCLPQQAVKLTRQKIFSGEKGENTRCANDLLDEHWWTSRSQVLEKANHAKFSSDNDLGTALLKTTDKVIVALSCNPKQHFWSIAIENDTFGKNTAGAILMNARAYLQQSQQPTNWRTPPRLSCFSCFSCFSRSSCSTNQSTKVTLP